MNFIVWSKKVVVRQTKVTMALHSKQMLLMLVLVVLFTKVATQPMSLPNCPKKCGSVTIPFPFGFTEGCFLDSTFLINCNKTSNSKKLVPFLPNTNQTVLNISLNGELHVAWPVAKDCYTKNRVRTEQTIQQINMTHFHISPTRNKLVAVGCDTSGILGVIDSEGNNYTSGCLAWCNRHADLVANESCSGPGCCQISVAQGRVLTEVFYFPLSSSSHSAVYDFNPCGYVFIVENGAYIFTTTDLPKLKKKNFPVLLDWAVGNQTCRKAQKDLSSNYACKADKSICYDAATNKSGYLCKCFDGYRGNPYLIHGCEGIIYFLSLVIILTYLYDSSLRDIFFLFFFFYFPG